MVILGIDPGTTMIGYALVEKNSDGSVDLITYGCLNVKSKKQTDRLKIISGFINDLILKYHPKILSIEKIFFTKNAKTALSVSEARGVIINCANLMDLEVMEFTPLQVKIAITGYGRAEKSQIQKMVFNILKLEKMPKSDDAADAIAIGLTACYTNAKLI